MNEARSGRADLILVPGADALTFEADLNEARRRDLNVHLIEYGSWSGHPIDAARDHYDRLAARIDAVLSEARVRPSDEARSTTGAARPLLGIGRNLGGSLLAWWARRRADFHGLVLTGAIPELSVFRRHGQHPSARRFRASLPRPEDLPRIAELASLDLTRSLREIPPERVLLQVGSADCWMDANAHASFAALARCFQVQFVDDEHAMVGAATVAARWDFLDRCLRSCGV